ncbi:Phosphoribosylformylglycinamidine synthase subunit PurL [uncultured archaeon]|nr:Phosphoribosylformylglycinamidine synthase subunit PurL [uncultured archaeon]
MVVRIEVGTKKGFSDPTGDAVSKRIASELLFRGVKSARVLYVYTIDEDMPEAEAAVIAGKLFSDPVIQDFSVEKPLVPSSEFNFAILVSFRPGVKDNAGDASREAIEDLLGRKLSGNVYTSRQYLFSGKMGKPDAVRIARELLANELIQHFEVKSAVEFGEAGFGTSVPRVDIIGGGMVNEISLNVPDRSLLEISRHRVLSLSLAEMKKIRAYYADPDTLSERRRMKLPENPTDAELECLAQTWSEHCKHKIFNAKITVRKGKGKKIVNSIFKTYIRASTEKLRRKKKWLVSVFTDNAGVFEFVPGWNVAMKVETHNTPSALDPFGGALTGILGVNRDVLGCGLGAKPIFNTDVFCFAAPDYAGEIPPRLFHPRRVLEGVRAGVAHGGNASGIPTVNGSLYFDERYLGKPLVYCGTGGIMPSALPDGRKSHEKRAFPGDRIFMIGGRIGKDGIHGATFSSVELHESSPVSAVQLGDPYTQKKVADFLLEARDAGLYNSVTDDGAGGLSSSVGEMAESSNGAQLHLDRAPLKYAGLDPWEILVSESQERMTVAVPPSKAGEFVSLARLRGVEVSDLGEFTSSGHFHVIYGAKTVAYIDMGFLHHGVPQLELEAELREKKLIEPAEDPAPNFGSELLLLLSRPNICSKEYIIRQYDHEVLGGSVVKPLCGKQADGPSDAGVMAPLFGRKEGIVVSNGICARYSDIDAYQMAANAIDEAVRNYVATGGSLECCSALDNFCWADPIQTADNPEGKHRLAQLVLACQGLYDACLAYGVPLISGKDSMKNDYKHGKYRISVPATLLVSAVGKIEDVSLAVTTDFKSEGDLIYALGETNNELGASEYYSMKGVLGANVPKVNFRKNALLYKKLEAAIKKQLVSSCHDCSDGGMAVAIAECCISGSIGAGIDLTAHAGKLTALQALFSESSGRFIVTVQKKDEKKFKSAMRGVNCALLGKVGGNGLTISLKGEKLLSLPVESLSASWKKTMDW